MDVKVKLDPKDSNEATDTANAEDEKKADARDRKRQPMQAARDRAFQVLHTIQSIRLNGKTIRLSLYYTCVTSLMAGGMALNVIGICIPSLFVAITTGRQIAVQRIDTFFGLYTAESTVRYRNGSVGIIRFATNFLDYEAIGWGGVQGVITIAILAEMTVTFLHLRLVFGHLVLNFSSLLVEVVLQISILIFLVMGLTLVEMQLYYLNVDGEIYLLKMLRHHDLLRFTGVRLDRGFKGPLHAYWILVLAEMCYLVALLCSLPQFISAVDGKWRRKLELMDRTTSQKMQRHENEDRLVETTASLRGNHMKSAFCDDMLSTMS